MKSKKCKNKNCQKPLPEGYKYKYCEKCRNHHVKHFKDAVKAVGAVVASIAIAVVTNGKIKPKG